MIDIDNATRLTILKEEYFKIHELMERFDEKVIVMKGWSITVSTAAVGAAFVEEKPALLLLAAAAAFFFWVIESFWKTFQEAHYLRLRAIESYFAGREADIEALQIGSTWMHAWHKGLGGGAGPVRARWGQRMTELHVALPHAAFVVGCLLLFTGLLLP